jgi:hypothetical protein
MRCDQIIGHVRERLKGFFHHLCGKDERVGRWSAGIRGVRQMGEARHSDLIDARGRNHAAIYIEFLGYGNRSECEARLRGIREVASMQAQWYQKVSIARVFRQSHTTP